MAVVLSRARIFVEPIVSSTGINTKAFTGFEHGLPVVMTHAAASGLHLDEKRRVPNIVPPEPTALVEALIRLHTNKLAWAQALTAQEAYIDALNAAERGRHDAEALVSRIETW
jgi:hypothetical protein